MNKLKYFLLGAISSYVLFTGGQVLAQSEFAPKIADWIKFTFNQEEKALPDGYTVLEYGGHTYIPTRFVSEMLGAEVNWNNQEQTVEINMLKSDPCQNTNPENQEVYQVLPQAQTKDDIRVEVYDIKKEDDRTNIYLRVKNLKSQPIQFEQQDTYFKSEIEVYKNTDVDDTIIYWKDKNWYHDIREDETKEGYVTLPPFEDYIKEGKLYLNVFQNDGSNLKTNFEFNIKFEE